MAMDIAGLKPQPSALGAQAECNSQLQTAASLVGLQRVLLDWDRWASPADEFIQVSPPLPPSQHACLGC